ncbi:MAG: 50S ribosomal protein L15 [Patescibacteria group bacterium]
MSLLELKSKSGKKRRKIVGRGNGSGRGTFSTRGGKGQTARSGGTRRPGFEGGQTPALRRMPKLKGFKNPNHVDYQIVNVEALNVFDNNAEVNLESLLAKKLISKKNKPVKLLGNGKLEKTLNITVHKASVEAIKAVEDNKGKVKVLISKDV